MRGINPIFLKKLNDVQREFILTSAVGLKFYSQFLLKYGYHVFIFGTTGAGKSNKGYWLVDWLKHLETQIWFDSGKQGEILPLLCMDRKIRIVVPTGCDVIIEELVGGKWQKIQNHPEVVCVSSPRDAIGAISEGSWSESRNRIRDTISIISFRNSFREKETAIVWVADFFQDLAERARNPHDGNLPNIIPATIHVDESQWAIAGKRVSGEGVRAKASEIIAENTMEMRSAGFRIVLYSQSHKGIPPAARENMLINIICHGGYVDDNPDLAKWCRSSYQWPHTPDQYLPWHGRFVFYGGDCYPKDRPWKFRLYPIAESDRNWIDGLRVRYVGRHDQRSGAEEDADEYLPELGRFSAYAIVPGPQEKIVSRWNFDGIDLAGGEND